jgi:hypothetical protein
MLQEKLKQTSQGLEQRIMECAHKFAGTGNRLKREREHHRQSNEAKEQFEEEVIALRR